MKRFKIFIASLFFFHPSLIAQNTEGKLFANFCEGVEKLNQNYSIKKGLTGTVLLFDPVTGEYDIQYGAPSVTLIEFKKNPKDEQIEILRSINLPIIPLKDTVYVIDTSFLFSSDLTYKARNIYFKSVRENTASKSVSQIGLNRIVMKKNKLILTTFFPNSTELAAFTFSIEGAAFKMIKKTIVDLFDPNFKNH